MKDQIHRVIFTRNSPISEFLLTFLLEFFKNLCDKTENTSEWGGEIELQALSKKLEVPITVYSAVSVPRSFGENYSAPNLLLSYHKHYYALGAHYNSVTDVQIQ